MTQVGLGMTANVYAIGVAATLGFLAAVRLLPKH
ncbi:hypothetical protein A8926_2205 [Saccharopolyspora spinosa]|uniref:Uncharacterized protein n=1 Tax=Saccharopolyspora spinosa TaxID=60894 RepID=A0A2N3XV58_SACSN|nr:hypothetical protein A8926_2205 [Saccharopolyspora spinosa]